MRGTSHASGVVHQSIEIVECAKRKSMVGGNGRGAMYSVMPPSLSREEEIVCLPVSFLDLILGRLRLDIQGIVKLCLFHHDADASRNPTSIATLVSRSM